MSAESERATVPELLATETRAVKPRDVVALLRSTVLELVPGDLELGVQSVSALIWGLVIETGYPDAVASLVALVDGSVSLYVSDGSGCVGCGANREVRTAGADLLKMAEPGLGLTTYTDRTAYPLPGHIRFYFLCIDGLRSVQVRLEELNSVDASLSALYFAGQRVINAIERTGAGQSIEQEMRLAQLAIRDSAPLRGAEPCLSVGNAVHRLRR